MKQLMHRFATAAATVTVAGGALVAVGSPASAALPAGQAHSGAVVSVAAERGDQGLSRTSDSRFEQRGEAGEGRSLWDGHRDWRSERDHRGYMYWHSSDEGRQLRYDGHRVHHWTDGRWAAVTSADERAYGFDRWYFDQLWYSDAAESRRSI
ncbi:hypothetical protein [Streptomyces sp. NPDC051219]|uniref:hypothetical protein n=1 Tax=Streptomyces sp. NPDC051219 TaxID=3155283 RepID=UPI0034457F46